MMQLTGFITLALSLALTQAAPVQQRAAKVACSSAAATATSSAVTVSVSAAAAATTSCAGDVTVTVSANQAVATATSTGNSSIGDFGSCSVPQIEFGTGFDNRKETSFEPVDKTSFNHGSAQNIDIITQFMCDTLTNSCGADATAKATCATASQAADQQTAKTGAQADAFNAAFGIQTNFAAVAEVDDQGNVVAGTGSGTAASAGAAGTSAATAAGGAASTDTAAAASASDTAAAATAGASDTAATAAAATATAAAATASSTAAAGSIGDFGSCSVPQIEFGTGFDGRKETSFEPVDKTSFNHGSAQNIDIITQFMCDTLTNSCGADATAKATCATASQAADQQTAKTGAQADAFNAAFGIQTNFAAVAEVSDQGSTIGGTGANTAVADAAQNTVSTAAAAAATTTAAAAATTDAATATATAAGGAAAATATAASGTAASGGNLQTFTGALGGVTAPTVTASGSQFQVEGNSAFNSLQSALERSCDVQNNQCANAANSSGNQGDLTVTACNQQQSQCAASVQSAAAAGAA